MKWPWRALIIGVAWGLYKFLVRVVLGVDLTPIVDPLLLIVFFFAGATWLWLKLGGSHEH